MATPTDRERLAEFIGIDVKKKPLAVGADPDSYNPVVSQTGTTIAKALGVDTPQAAQRILDKPTIGDVTSNWIEEGYVNNSVPAWQKALATGPIGGFFNVVQKPLSLSSSLLKESVDLVTGQGFDFGDLRQQYNDNYTFGRLLHDYDLLQNRDSGWSKFGAAALGFTGDVLLDPLTYLGLVGKPVALAAKLASSGTRNLSRKAVGETLKKATVGQIAARAGDDVVRTLDDGVFQQIGDAIASGAVANSSKSGRAGVQTGNTVVRRGKGGKGYQLDILGREAVEEGTQEVVVASIKIGDSIADDITDFYQISSKAQQKGASLIDPDELRRAAGFIARSELDEAGRAVGAQGYRGPYFTGTEAANAKVGIGFKVPLTGPVGRALRVADPIANAINKVTRKGVGAPVGIRVMTSETPIIGKMAMSLPRGVRRAVNRAGTSKAGMALVGGKMNALKRTLRETTDAVAIQQGKRVIHAVGRGTATGRRIKPVLMSLVNDLAKTIDSVDGVDPTDVYYALGGDTAAINKVNAIDAELLPKAERTVAQLRAEANRAGGREFLSELENYVPRQLTDDARDAIQESLAATGRYNKRIHKNKGAYSGTGPELRRGYVDTDAFEAAAAKKAATEGITQEAAEAALKKEGTLTDKFFGEQLYKPGSTVDGDVIGSVEKQIADIIERNGGDYSLFVDDINVALRGWVDQVAPRVGEVATETILTQDGIIVQKLAEYVKFPSAAAITASKKLNKAEEVFASATAKVMQRGHDVRFAVGSQKRLAQQALEEAERSAQIAEDALDAAVREETEVAAREAALTNEVLAGNIELEDLDLRIKELNDEIAENSDNARKVVDLETERQKLVADLDRLAANPKRIKWAYQTVASATARKIHIERNLREIFGSGENFEFFQRSVADFDASEEAFPFSIDAPDGTQIDVREAFAQLDEILEIEDVSGVGLWMGVERDIDILNLGNQVNNPANKAAYMLDKINSELDEAVGVAQRYMNVVGEEIELPTPQAVMESQQKIREVVDEFQASVEAGEFVQGDLADYLTNNPEVVQAMRTYWAVGDLPGPTYLPDLGALQEIETQVGSKIVGRLDELSAEIEQRGSDLVLTYSDIHGNEQTLSVRDYVYLRKMRNAIEAKKTTSELPLGFSRPGIDELNVDLTTQAGTNPGGFATDAKGNRYYVKRYDEKINEIDPETGNLLSAVDEDGNVVPSTDRAASEVLANAMYRELGFGAPASYMSVGADGGAWHIAPVIDDFETVMNVQIAELGGIQGVPGNTVTLNNLSVWTDPNTGAQKIGVNPPNNAKSYPLGDAVRHGWMADVLVSNWDAMGQWGDNIGITPWNIEESAVVRIDNGGTFFNRAQGLSKSDGGWDWRSVSEFDDPERFQTSISAGVPEVGLQSQQLDNILLLRARYGGWENFVRRHAPELNDGQIKKFSQFLEVRSKNLAERFNKSFFQPGSEDLRKSAFFGEGYKQAGIEQAFDGDVYIDPQAADVLYSDVQRTSQADGYPAWLPRVVGDQIPESQAMDWFSTWGDEARPALEVIDEGRGLGSRSDVSIDRDERIIVDVGGWKDELVYDDEGDQWGRWEKIRYDNSRNPTAALDTERQLRRSTHAELWGDEAPENVSYGLVILRNNDEGDVMLRMPTDNTNTGEPFGGVKWTFSKGAPNPNESPVDAAIRETFEETNLEVVVHEPLPGAYEGSTGTTYYMVASIKPGTPGPPELVSRATGTPSDLAAPAPSIASLGATGNLAAAQMGVSHSTMEPLYNLWNEYARFTERGWGDKWGKNFSTHNVAYGLTPETLSKAAQDGASAAELEALAVAAGEGQGLTVQSVYQLAADVPNGSQNIKVYGLPPREAQLAAQLAVQMGIETNPSRLNSISDRMTALFMDRDKQAAMGITGQGPLTTPMPAMNVDQVARLMDNDEDLLSRMVDSFRKDVPRYQNDAGGQSISSEFAQETYETLDIIDLAIELKNVRGASNVIDGLDPGDVEMFNRIAGMDAEERLKFAVWMKKKSGQKFGIDSFKFEETWDEVRAWFAALDQRGQAGLDARAEEWKLVGEWANKYDFLTTNAEQSAIDVMDEADQVLFRSQPTEFLKSVAKNPEEFSSRLHKQGIDVWKRSLSNDGYTMAAWFNDGELFGSTVPGARSLGSNDMGAWVTPNLIAINPMGFSYKNLQRFVPSFEPELDEAFALPSVLGVEGGREGAALGREGATPFVGADQFMRDFESLMDSAVTPPKYASTDEDPLESLVSAQSELLASMESVTADYQAATTQLRAAKRRSEQAAVDVSKKQSDAMVQRQIATALVQQEEKVSAAIDTLNRLGIGEGVALQDIPNDDLIALNQATKILIQADTEMNRLAFSELEQGKDGWFDLISKTAEQRSEIHRVANREFVLDTAFNSGMKPIGNILQGPQQIVESMQAAERFVARGGAGAFFRKYDKLHNLLRAYMIMKPGFHMRNYFSGVFMNHLAGMDWSNYRRFMRAYWKFQEEEAVRLGLPDKASKMRKAMRARGINPSNVSAEHVDYVRELAESGTLGGAGGQVATEFIDYSTGKAGKATVKIGGKKVNLLAAANPLSSQNAFLQLSRNTGMATETFLRGSLGFDALYKGGTADEAFENVMKFHFDYDDLSDFERNVVKKVVPFYTWTRKNLPLMFEMAARRPAIFNKYTSFKKEMEYGQERPKIVPKWMERQGAIQLPFKYEGENMFVLPDMPFKQLLELVEPPLRFDRDESVMDRIQTTMETLGTQITPLIKAPYEWKAKQNLWKGYNFDESYEVVPTAYAKVPFLMDLLSLPGLARKNSQGQWAMKDYELHAMAQLMPTLSDLRRLFPDEERYQERSVSTWISFVFGAGIRTNTKWEQRMERNSRFYEKRDEMEQERSLRTARLR